MFEHWEDSSWPLNLVIAVGLKNKKTYFPVVITTSPWRKFCKLVTLLVEKYFLLSALMLGYLGTILLWENFVLFCYPMSNFILMNFKLTLPLQSI